MPKVEITHPDKILFPKEKITKEDLIQYYTKVAPRMLIHLKDRPVVIQRYPNGINQPGFFQKNASDYFPSWIETIRVKRKEEGKGTLVICKNKETLLYLVNQGTIAFHIWLSKQKKIDYPDRIIFDLDPPSKNRSLAKQAAFILKEILETTFHLNPFVMTTGSVGFHVVVPIQATHSFDEVRSFAKEVSLLLSKQEPKLFTTSVRKAQRRGRVFIDYLRNSYAQHAIAPYSLRPLPGAPIAMPISWKNLKNIEPQSFSLKKRQLSFSKTDPWSTFFKKAKSISRFI